MNVKVNLIVMFQTCCNKWYSCRCAKVWWLFSGWSVGIDMELQVFWISTADVGECRASRLGQFILSSTYFYRKMCCPPEVAMMWWRKEKFWPCLRSNRGPLWTEVVQLIGGWTSALLRHYMVLSA